MEIKLSGTIREIPIEPITTYIVVNTQHGYLMTDPNPEADPAFIFTKDIAQATTFTNFEEVKTLCDKYIASAWMCNTLVDPRYMPCYSPFNKFNRDIDELRRIT